MCQREPPKRRLRAVSGLTGKLPKTTSERPLIGYGDSVIIKREALPSVSPSWTYEIIFLERQSKQGGTALIRPCITFKL